jgi:hypothetical protein
MFAGAANASDVPTIVASSVEGAANVWVAADAAFDAQGNLRADTMGQAAVFSLRDYRANRERHGSVRVESMPTPAASDDDACGGVFFTLPAVEQYRQNNSFDDLVRESSDILAGRVIAVREGFFRNVPASLLHVNITQVVRESGTINLVDRTVLIAYPYATLHAGGETYCTRPQGDAINPSVGDRVLVFDYLPGEGVTHSIIEVDTKRQFVIEHRGVLSLPITFAELRSLRTFDAVAQHVAAVAGSRKRSPGGRQ